MQCCQGTWPNESKSNSGKGRDLGDLNNSYPTSGMGRARVRNPGPHFPEPLLCLPYTRPQCLCRDTLDTQPSSPNSDGPSSDSGPSSLESITDPKSLELGYEA